MKFFNKNNDPNNSENENTSEDKNMNMNGSETPQESKTQLTPKRTTGIPTFTPPGFNADSASALSANLNSKFSPNSPNSKSSVDYSSDLGELSSDDNELSDNDSLTENYSDHDSDNLDSFSDSFNDDNEDDYANVNFNSSNRLTPTSPASPSTPSSSLSSPDTISANASSDKLDDDGIDEDEVLSNVETSALKEDKEPVLEILTPGIKLPTSRRDRNKLEDQGVLSRSELDSAEHNDGNEVVVEDSIGGKPSKPKKERKPLFGGRKNKKKANEPETTDIWAKKDVLNNSDDDNTDADEDDNEEENKKVKKSLKDMTISDLLPGKKSKEDVGIPIGNNIVIDLMPQSHKDIVETREAKRRWTGIFAGVVVGCVALGGGSVLYNFQTQSQVSNEQSKHETLDLQIARHAEVNQALQSESSARVFLDTAAGNEIDWNELITTIESNLPAGTNISSLNVTNGGTLKDEVSSAITVNLTSDSTIGYSDALRSVQDINGVQQVEIGGLSVGGENQYVYTMSFTYDTSILTERFSKEEVVEEEEAGSEADALDAANLPDDPYLNEILDDPNAETVTEEE